MFNAVIDAPSGTVGIRLEREAAREIVCLPVSMQSASHFPIMIPCHRVVCLSRIVGFETRAADGFFRNVKRWLLAHEGISYA